MSSPATITCSAIIAISPTTAACGDLVPEKYIYGKAVFRYWPVNKMGPGLSVATEKRATLLLEDGRVFRGKGHGFEGEAVGEVVFNTSMTGYQEILTDPSYAGQIVTMTYPLIGNTGINPEDVESRKPFLEAFIVRRMSPIASNWRTTETLDDYLHANRIPVISGHRHPRAGAAHPAARVRCAESFRSSITTRRRCCNKVKRRAADGRMGPRQQGEHREVVCRIRQEPLTFVEFSAACGNAAERSSRRGLRFRHQAQHSAQPGALRRRA